MRNLKKRFMDFIINPTEDLEDIMPELLRLKANMALASELQPLQGIVKFFNHTSPWHDRGIDEIIAGFESVNYGQYDMVITGLRWLSINFKNVGRNIDGINRTLPSERVSADKIYLGGIYGLPTQPLPFWIELKNEPKGGWATEFPLRLESMNSYDVVSEQAFNFMMSHTSNIARTIETLDKILYQI